MNAFKTLPVVALLLCLHATTRAAVPLPGSFDDLPTPPALNDAIGLFYANNGSSLYAGVLWDDRFSVAGIQYSTAPNSVPPGPLYGIPHSGSYYLTNASQNLPAGLSNDGLLITTTKLLTGAYFGRNEYYGFGAGADQITISALGATGVIGTPVVFNLLELRAGEPEFLQFVNTQSFASLTGITGYRIDRREGPSQGGQWVADDFTFVAAAPVPEPETYAMLLAGLAVLGWTRRRRTR